MLTLRLQNPPLQGQEVAHLHGLLVIHSLIDASGAELREQVFGPLTEQSVRLFQARAGLRVDGICGDLTWNELTAADPTLPLPLPGPDYGSMSPLAAEALRVADEQLIAGVHEQPLGSNSGPEVDQYLTWYNPGDDLYLRLPPHERAWCGGFAAWCIDEAAKRLKVPNPIRAWKISGRPTDLMSGRKWVRAAEAAGRLRLEPTPGCVGIVGVDLHHVTLVAGLTEGLAHTREGNSLHRVSARARRRGEFSWYIEFG